MSDSGHDCILPLPCAGDVHWVSPFRTVYPLDEGEKLGAFRDGDEKSFACVFGICGYIK